MKRPHYVTMGPPIEVVPVSHFRRGLPRGVLEDAWSVCGPSAALNMRKLEYWQVVAAAYVEGLHHGSAVILEQRPQLEMRGIDA